MNTYKALLNTGEVTYYQATSPQAYEGMNPPEFHILEPDEPSAVTVHQIELPKITKLAFDNRFTIPELTGIEMASIDDTVKTLQQRVLASSLRIIMRKQTMATCIDLNLPDASTFLQVLVGVGLLSSDRVSQILSPVAQDKELYHG